MCSFVGNTAVIKFCKANLLLQYGEIKLLGKYLTERGPMLLDNMCFRRLDKVYLEFLLRRESWYQTCYVEASHSII